MPNRRKKMINRLIKERIEALRRGEVPEGYEKTAFGIFPRDWAKDELSGIAEYCGGGTPSSHISKYWEGSIPWISSADVVEGNIFGIVISRYITKEAVDNSATKICPKGSIAVVTRVGVGKLAYIDRDYCTSQDFTNIIKSSVNKVMLAYAIQRTIQKHKKNAQGTSIKGITAKEFGAIQLAYPRSTDEQERIAEILMQWDKAIELQEKLIEAYRKLKRYCLDKMFPKKGSNVPEVRFPGFTAPWEQRKFAEVYSLASEGGTPNTNIDTYYLNGTIPFVRIEDTENKYIDSVKTFITEEGLKHSSAWLIPSGSVIFTNGATVGNVAINRIPVATKQGILGIIPNKTVTAEYLYYLLSAGFFQREVRNRQATGTFATIILKNLNEINVFVPDKLEQRKISDYLSSIDNLITLHQRKRDKLEAQRKVMQQYLLTGIVRV